MSKKLKRMCPAVGREINAAECGENRCSRYACPADCSFNPFSPDQFEELGELEKRVDEVLFNWLCAPGRLPRERSNVLREAGEQENMGEFGNLLLHTLYLERLPDSRTRAQQFEQEGFPGLNNDGRVLMRNRMKVFPGLFEVRRVVDSARVEVVDLLEEGGPMQIMDLPFAGVAARFQVMVGFIHPMPHYFMITGTPQELGDLLDFDPPDVLRELVRHLGGPTEGPALRDWMGANMARLHEAMEETEWARDQRVRESMDEIIGQTSYDLVRSMSECRDLLNVGSTTEADPLSKEEEEEGFIEALVWIDSEGVRTPSALPVLGRVLIRPSQVRIETMGRRRMGRLRQEFEDRMGDAVRFTGDRNNVLPAAPPSTFDPALVPPCLLAVSDRLELTGFRLNPIPGVSLAEREARWKAELDEAFPDHPLPILNGRTPREAAQDPELRPRVVSMLKRRIRQTDEENLRTGGTKDVNGLLRDLGVTELIVDPPPWREPPEEDQSDDEYPGPPPGGTDHWPWAPRIPEVPFVEEEAHRRVSKAMTQVRSALLVNAIDESGINLIIELEQSLKAFLEPDEQAMLLGCLGATWFSFVPPRHRVPTISFDHYLSTFKATLARLEAAIANGADDLDQMSEALFDQIPQVPLAKGLVAYALSHANPANPEMKGNPAGLLIRIAGVLALVVELDRVLRRERE